MSSEAMKVSSTIPSPPQRNQKGIADDTREPDDAFDRRIQLFEDCSIGSLEIGFISWITAV